MYRALVVAGCALILVGCGSEQPVAPQQTMQGPAVVKVPQKRASWECKSGVVIHVGRDSVCVVE